MITSDKLDLLSAALVKAQSVMEGAKRTSANPFYHSKYAELSEVWETCRKPLTDNGLCFIQAIGSDKETFNVTIPGKDKAPDKEVIYMWLEVTSRLQHISEQFIEDTISLPVEADPQSIGKVTTYLRRYGLMALCGIAPEDDDGNAASEARPIVRAATPKQGSQEAPMTRTEAVAQSNGHYCSEHQTPWFKKGNMKAYAHPILTEDKHPTGKWCNEPVAKTPPVSNDVFAEALKQVAKKETDTIDSTIDPDGYPY